MRIQETMQNCCKGITNFATNAANWAGRTFSAVSTQIATLAKKVAEFVKPHFEALMNFAREHKGAILLAVGAVAVGALLATLFRGVCCKKQAAETTASTAATIPASTTAVTA